MLLNAGGEAVDFTLPEYAGGRRWVGLVDTTLSDQPPRQSFEAGDICPLAGQSLLVLASRM
jgi:hypothetical protein